MKKHYPKIHFAICLFGLLAFSLPSFSNQYSVTNTNDTGAGSLAQAITDANSNPGLDTIVFNLTEGASMTIAPTTSLPAISGSVFIDGYSQTGAATGTIAGRTIRVNIDGNNLPAATNLFVVNTTNVTIAGLAIYRSKGAGIYISNNADAFIWGNYIGTDSTGLTTTLGNTGSGVLCNTFNFTGNSGLVVGTNGDGTNDANEGNLISCNSEDGVFLWRTSSSTVAGNIIGLNKNGAGAAGFGNVRNGILATVSSDNNVIGTDGDGVSDALEGNYFANSGGRGILVASVSNSNVVAGNVVGLNAAGAAAGNGQNGIEINPGSNNRIGTNSDGVSDANERNVIGSNTGHGIIIVGGDFFGSVSGSNNNIVAGNSIGTDAAGTAVRGNSQNGVFISSNNNQTADDNIIGSNLDGTRDNIEGNLIANNAKGVVITTPGGTSTHLGNRISANRIYDNTNIGIDLADNGVTANDDGDPDAGANELFNFPFLTRSNVQGGFLNVAGVAPAGSVIDFYIADASAAEGRTYLFSAREGNTFNGITDDSTGTASYSDVTFGSGTDAKFGFILPVSSLPVSVTAGTVIIATATKFTAGDNSTSEFGPSFISTLPARLNQFGGRVNNGVITLNWNTSQEISNSRYEIERSANGTQFSVAGTIPARGTQVAAYSFIDNKPLGTVNYYRLKQVDVNGSVTYSRVILIRSDLDKIIAKITPNPFQNVLNLSFQLQKDENITVRLFSPMGQLVKQQTAKAGNGMNTISLGDLSNLPSGNYTVEITGETVSFRQQVVKQ